MSSKPAANGGDGTCFLTLRPADSGPTPLPPDLEPVLPRRKRLETPGWVSAMLLETVTPPGLRATLGGHSVFPRQESLAWATVCASCNTCRQHALLHPAKAP